MARQTAHKWCVKCDGRAEFGVFTGFYGLASKVKSGTQVQKRRPQITGTLPSRGFCSSCLLKYAKGQGWDHAGMEELEARLKRK
jgi:hypothetical protein